ncbi:MAG TPA: hypothetical protein VG734_08035 [Lacunisphaera sp.]|nr:hypothetical protein [Lacunisphaera sp.]
MIRLVAPFGALGALFWSGCSSTPKHSNVLIFGTNTRLALDITYDPKTQEPDILFGYKRQEAVWMPLLANLSPASGDDLRAPNPAELSANKDLLYIGKDDKKTDTYSVLASFGAKFEAKTKNEITTGSGSGGAKPESSGSGGLAQFFATGLAARILADHGGEALVSVQKSDAPARAREEVAKAEVAKAYDFAKVRNTSEALLAEARALLAQTDDTSLDGLIDKAVAADLMTAEYGANLKQPGTAANVKRAELLDAANAGNNIQKHKPIAKFLGHSDS